MKKFPSKESKGDYAIIALKTAASMIPIVGGPAAEFIGLINTPLEHRKIEWFNDISKRLKSLENENFSLEQLKDDNEFITIVTHASQIAIRNHEEEKLNALRNAVINTAKRIDVGENFRIIFLSYVDLMSPWHLNILKYFENPKDACIKSGVNPEKYSMGGASSMLEDCFPEIRGHREFYDLIYSDLASKGLVLEGPLHVTSSMNGITQKRTTIIGDNFLRFIS